MRTFVSYKQQHTRTNCEWEQFVSYKQQHTHYLWMRTFCVLQATTHTLFMNENNLCPTSNNTHTLFMNENICVLQATNTHYCTGSSSYSETHTYTSRHMSTRHRECFQCAVLTLRRHWECFQCAVLTQCTFNAHSKTKENKWKVHSCPG